MNVTSVRLTEEVEAGLAQAAAKTRRSKSWIINEAVRDYLEHLDAGERRWRDTLVALDEVERGELVDGDKMLRWIGTWGTAGEKSKAAPLRRAGRKKQ
jgi:predicted transcriptional regulator